MMSSEEVICFVSEHLKRNDCLLHICPTHEMLATASEALLHEALEKVRSYVEICFLLLFTAQNFVVFFVLILNFSI